MECGKFLWWKNYFFLISGFIAAEVTCTHVQQNCRPTCQALEVYSWEDERKGTHSKYAENYLKAANDNVTLAAVFKSCYII